MVENELSRFESTGVIKPFTFSEWPCPTVNVVKKVEDIRETVQVLKKP